MQQICLLWIPVFFLQIFLFKQPVFWYTVYDMESSRQVLPWAMQSL